MFKRKRKASPESSDEFNPFAQPQKPKGFKAWVKDHKKLFILLVAVGVILLAGAGVGAYYLLNQKPAEVAQVPEPTPEPEPEPVHYYSPLTGNEVKTEATTKQAVTAVMIENSPDARPQSGLKQAGVVFEAIAEGGITRFLVLYQEQKPALIGPVRSVRMYYVDWVAAFDASVAHVGGSAKALKELRNGKYRDIDQFFNSASYWRATDRYAPHNVYTNFTRLDALNARKGYKTSDFTGFTRTDSEPAAKPTATKINVKISSALFNSSYTYDAKTNTYKRSQAGQPHKDREDGQIQPRVVVVLKVTESTVFEDGYRESINAIGKGKAVIFQNGTAKEVNWQKKSRSAQLSFTDADGKDVPLARGQTWITAVPQNKGGNVTWQ